MTQAERDIRRKLGVFDHASQSGNVSKTCRYFGITRETYYQWKRAYTSQGEKGLINRKPCPQNLKRRTPAPIEEKILYLRKTYHLGPMRIAWYLESYHNIRISGGGVYYVLKRNGLNHLPRNAPRRSITTHRYEKQVPGHHIQVDVNFLNFHDPSG